MKSKSKQKTWYSTDEAERDLEIVAESIGDSNESQAIRYALRLARREALKNKEQAS